MAGFADLVRRAQPALVAGGVAASATEGRDWEWRFTGLIDDTGTAVDLATNTTITCKVLSGVNGTTVVTLTATGADDGSFTLKATHTQTKDLVSGNTPVRGVWSCSMTSGSYDVQVWLPSVSPFIIESN